jgi:hypothetical protein
MDARSIAALIEWTHQTCGALHILHNNVGATIRRWISQSPTSISTAGTHAQALAQEHADRLQVRAADHGSHSAAARSSTRHRNRVSPAISADGVRRREGGVISLTQYVATQYGRTASAAMRSRPA